METGTGSMPYSSRTYLIMMVSQSSKITHASIYYPKFSWDKNLCCNWRSVDVVEACAGDIDHFILAYTLST